MSVVQSQRRFHRINRAFQVSGSGLLYVTDQHLLPPSSSPLSVPPFPFTSAAATTPLAVRSHAVVTSPSSSFVYNPPAPVGPGPVQVQGLVGQLTPVTPSTRTSVRRCQLYGQSDDVEFGEMSNFISPQTHSKDRPIRVWIFTHSRRVYRRYKITNRAPLWLVHKLSNFMVTKATYTTSLVTSYERETLVFEWFHSACECSLFVAASQIWNSPQCVRHVFFTSPEGPKFDRLHSLYTVSFQQKLWVWIDMQNTFWWIQRLTDA
jgi:hypothetical protein